jgi:hypothetical protein
MGPAQPLPAASESNRVRDPTRLPFFLVLLTPSAVPERIARAPLRLIVQSPPATAGIWLRLYRIELRCEQAEALRQRCDELGDVLEQMPNQPDRDTGAALKRAARTFYHAIRFSRRERSPR